jgi:hypothetical protein
MRTNDHGPLQIICVTNDHDRYKLSVSQMTTDRYRLSVSQMTTDRYRLSVSQMTTDRYRLSVSQIITDIFYAYREDRPRDTADPATLFGTNSEINQKAPPHRVGSLRSKRPLPTGHFATNEIRPTPIPMRLFPYEGK